MTLHIPETNSQIPYNGLQSVHSAPTETHLSVLSPFSLFLFWTCYWLVSAPEMSYLKYLPDLSLTSFRSLLQHGHFDDTFLAILLKPQLSPNHFLFLFPALLYPICWSITLADFVFPKDICQWHNSHYLRMWLYWRQSLERDNQLKMRPLGLALIQTDWCPWKKTKRHQGCIEHRARLWWVHREGNHLQAKERGLGRSQTVDILKIHFCCISYPSFVIAALENEYG